LPDPCFQHVDGGNVTLRNHLSIDEHSRRQHHPAGDFVDVLHQDYLRFDAEVTDGLLSALHSLVALPATDAKNSDYDWR